MLIAGAKDAQDFRYNIHCSRYRLGAVELAGASLYPRRHGLKASVRVVSDEPRSMFNDSGESGKVLHTALLLYTACISNT
jgi:hypothetical protein